ncbi:techylectin-5A-like isoform X2 [Argiope bruennichi]|uniref:techylectin-5A-like isoform X1 n=1 Tax=Argiope bruennichi TaxID=94029 RepID=UPI002494F7A4|nr:techylectin-5A-like isoform X1 [Argiope bruennichi]XP_055949709.1 techylectin-5A-like isoform X2 [Argiope bruennichi]
MGKILIGLAVFVSACIVQCIGSTGSPTTPTTTQTPQPKFYPMPKDCEEVRRNGHNASGVYTVYPRNRIGMCSVAVYCDMKTDGGGWMVIQRRGDFGSPINYFAKKWQQYKLGFGSLEKDFWLGNDAIFALTNQGAYTVRFDLQNANGVYAYATYDSFYIEDEQNKYKLHISGYSGNAGDSMNYHNENFFSTPDHDNDRSSYYNCANDRSSGWWFNFCLTSNLNGMAWKGPYKGTNNYNDGIEWQSFMGSKYSLISTEIKIRPRIFCTKHHAEGATTPKL